MISLKRKLQLSLKHAIAFVVFSSQLFANTGDYKVDAVFPGHDGEKKTFFLTFFLPYNPTTIAYTQNSDAERICQFRWPKGHFYSHTDYLEDAHRFLWCDLLWIDSDGNELDILHKAANRVNQASVIFTTTHFFDEGAYYQNLRTFLESSGFTLLGHWYWENQNGQAIFIKSHLFNAAMRTLNFTPSNICITSSAAENRMEQHFRKVDHKSSEHTMDGIDFIYMINLDERPEKFALTSFELSLYGIYPYRFSAVNGWQLPTSVLNQIGVKFTSPFGQEKFLGSIYREIDGQECLGNEIIKPDGETYFTLGMSRGAMGCALSHLSVLQDAYDSGYHTIWIMEDDVEVIDNPGQIPELIQKLDSLVGDWDILYTDTDTKDSAGYHVPCRAVAARLNFNVEPLSSFLQRFYPISNDLSRIGMRYGSYSMIVRRSGMEKILQYFKTYGIFLPYDMDIWLNPDLKIYSVNKDIVSHRAGAPTDNCEPQYLNKNNE